MLITSIANTFACLTQHFRHPFYRRVLSSCVLSCVIVFVFVLSRLVLSCRVVLCLFLFGPVLSCLALYCPVLPCTVQSCPVLSCPVLSCPLACAARSCLVLSCLLLPYAMSIIIPRIFHKREQKGPTLDTEVFMTGAIEYREDE